MREAVPMGAPSDTIGALRMELSVAADPQDAVAMAAYMKHRFPFLGVKAPARRRASRAYIDASKRTSADDAVTMTMALRAQPEREFHYVASDVLAANARRLRADHIGDLERCLTTDSWWDTVDALASPTVGTMVLEHPIIVAVMDRWIDDHDFWLARAAIIHQLRFKERTDAERLFTYALRRADDDEFYVRRAIGWALHQYARTDPVAVCRFVDDHRKTLSPLTVREATEHF